MGKRVNGRERGEVTISQPPSPTASEKREVGGAEGMDAGMCPAQLLLGNDHPPTHGAVRVPTSRLAW